MPITKVNRINLLTAAGGFILEGFREFSSDWHYMPLDNVILLSLFFDAPINQDVEALAFETIEHITKPLSVNMHPVLHIGEIATEIYLVDELEQF